MCAAPKRETRSWKSPPMRRQSGEMLDPYVSPVSCHRHRNKPGIVQILIAVVSAFGGWAKGTGFELSGSARQYSAADAHF